MPVQINIPRDVEDNRNADVLTFGAIVDLAIGFVRRRYLIILAFLLLSLIFGALYLLLTPPTYTASASMIIDTRASEAVQPSSTQTGGTLVDPAWLESQIGILNSQSVAAYVVRKLQLDSEPEFYAPVPGFLDRLEVVASTYLGLNVRRLLQQHFGLDAESPDPSVESKEARHGAAIGAYLMGLRVRRVGASYIVQIDFQSRDPKLAAKVADALPDAYAAEQLNAKFEASRRATDWLKERLDSLRTQAAKAEQAVIEYKAKHNIVSAGDQSINEKQIVDLNSQLNAARTRSADTKARLDRIEAVLRANEVDSTINETVSDTLNSSIINSLRTKYLELVNREASWSAKYGPNHSAVANLRSQMREIRRSVLDELGRIAETHKSEYVIAESRQKELEKQLTALFLRKQGLSRSEVELRSLESTAQSYRKIYDDFLGRYTEADQRKSLPLTEARLISPAFVYKSHPKTPYVWMLALVIGGILGVGIGALREVFDHAFRTAQQVETALGLDCLAMIPLLKSRQLRGVANRRLLAHGSAGIRQISSSGGLNVLRTAVGDSLSPFAEAIRSIRMTVDANAQPRRAKIVGITSCSPNEGKSTVALSVAQLIAQSGNRVILVDFDSRNPTLSRILSPKADAGLFEALKPDEPCALADVVWTDPTTQMAFLPVVPHHDSPTLADMFIASNVDSLFEELASKFDYVVADFPPLGPMADVRASSRYIDAYLLVVEWGRTKVEAVQRSLRGAGARGIREKIAGCVLNKVDIDMLGRYDRAAKHDYDTYGYAG
jgi:succinoglycan biosynthesis transport protein ExoP